MIMISSVIGSRAFQVAAPVTWNKIPLLITVRARLAVRAWLRYGHGYRECHGGHLGVTSRLPEIAATQLCDGPAYAGWWQEGHPAVKKLCSNNPLGNETLSAW